MTDSIVVRLLIFGVAIVFAADLPAQTSESAASQRAKFNQVFVKTNRPGYRCDSEAGWTRYRILDQETAKETKSALVFCRLRLGTRL